MPICHSEPASGGEGFIKGGTMYINYLSRKIRNEIYLNAFRLIINRNCEFICSALNRAYINSGDSANNDSLLYCSISSLFPEFGNKEYTRDTSLDCSSWYNLDNERMKRATVLYLCYLETL